MNHLEAMQLLADSGFDTGWALADGVLILWEHDTEPPSPLVRPTEATDEATTADADTGTDPE
jgi:hypothetical protein